MATNKLQPLLPAPKPAVPLPAALPRLAPVWASFAHILFATDFSPVSERALPLAVAYARMFGADLRLIYALPDPHRHEMTSESYSDFHVTSLPAPDGKNHRAECEAAQAGLARMSSDPLLAGLRVETGVIELEPLRAISDAVERQGVDLVVLGTHGRHGFSHVLAGSVAEAVLRRSRCPVLVLGPEAEVKPEIRRVLLASGLGAGARRPAFYAASIAQQLQAELTLMHVIAGPPPEDAEAALDAARIEAELAAVLPAEAGHWPTLQLRSSFGDPARNILHAVHAINPDLLVLGVGDDILPERLASHLPWTRLGHLLPQVSCPVLTVRSRA